MSEREYFSLRYAVPGYAFLLFVIGINLWPLREILKIVQAEVFGAFLAFLSLFAGSAIGFLISQIWYLWFNTIKRPFRIRELEPLANEFVRSAGLKQDLIKETYETRKERYEIEAILDYAFNTEEEGRFRNYSERRWDMYILLSCTCCSVLIGALFGATLRLTFQFALFEGFSGMSALSRAELLSWIIVFSSAIILTAILRKGRSLIMASYVLYFKGFITRLCAEKKVKELKKVFPNSFLEKAVQETDKPGRTATGPAIV